MALAPVSLGLVAQLVAVHAAQTQAPQSACVPCLLQMQLHHEEPGGQTEGFFGSDVQSPDAIEPQGAQPSETPPMPPVEELPPRGEPSSPIEVTTPVEEPPREGTPAMPPVEELPPRKGPPTMPPVEELPPREGPPADTGPVVFGGDADRKPISGGGSDFFDPGKLNDTGPSGGAIQIRGYLGVNFSVTERTDQTMRNPDTGRFEQLRSLPHFGGGAANIYVGAPIYSDVVYVRVAFEFLSIPRALPGSADVSPASAPVVLMESAALEVNPFAWAKKSPRWFGEGFKLTGGVFVVPFGLEDEQHDAPVRWFVTRPLPMSTGRVYPGSWIDAGIMLKWHPVFRANKPIRPIEIDVGAINGDACTQTRTTDLLYRYQPIGQVDEVCEHRLRTAEIPRGDGSVLGITPDNNGNKSFFVRMQLRPLPALNLGGSYIWGTHPRSTFVVQGNQGQSFIDTEQAPTWRAGAHFDLNLDEIFQSPYPLPYLRSEFVYGIDRAASPVDPDMPVLADRHMMGAYAQIAQPLWRRKKTRLPGLILQYRFDYADPNRSVPRSLPGGAVVSNFADEFLYDEAFVGHIIGLRLPVLPRFTLKAEYGILLEDGGTENQLHNNFFSLQAVADF